MLPAGGDASLMASGSAPWSCSSSLDRSIGFLLFHDARFQQLLAGEVRWELGFMTGDSLEVAHGAAAEERLRHLRRPRPAFAGVAMDRPRVMGVINVTPDSFSDGGERFDPGRAVADGLAMLARATRRRCLRAHRRWTRPGRWCAGAKCH